MKASIYIVVIVGLFFLCACRSGKASNPNKNEAAEDTVKVFTLPTLPATMTAPDQRAAYLVKHYWDNVNFADTNYIHHPEVTEQAWADYCDILNHVPLATAQQAMKETIERTNADKKVFEYITELADKYLYDPNSPLRNEEFYIPVLEAMVASPVLEEIEKVRPKARLELAHKNRVGTKAMDFTYTLASGATGSLHQLNADYVLLFINNPDCHACAETLAALKNAPIISQLVGEKKLAVLSVYPDEELEAWRKHLRDFPQEWTNGYDKDFTIREKQLYDLKAIPTLYLLNKEKTVLLKDAAAGDIEEYLLLRQ